MSYFIVNKTTGEMRPCALDEAAPTLMQSFSDDDSIEGRTSDAPSPVLGDVPLASGPQIKGLEQTEVLIDTSREVYNPTTGEIIPLSPRPRVNPANLPARLDTLESRLTALESQLAEQANSLLGFAATIEHLVHCQGDTLPEVIEEARERIKTIEAERAGQAEESSIDEEPEQQSGSG